MMKGTSASAGIGIGKAAIVEETELVIKKETQQPRRNASRQP